MKVLCMVERYWWVIDVDKWLKTIPRPDRSGYISVAMMLGLMYTVLHPPVPLAELCQLMPWGCPVEIAEVRKEELNKATPIVWTGGGAGEEDDSICHLDVQTIPGPAINYKMYDKIRHFNKVVQRRESLSQNVYPNPNSEEWLLLDSKRPNGKEGRHNEWGVEHFYEVQLAISDGDQWFSIPYGVQIKLRWHCGNKVKRERDQWIIWDKE